MTEIAIANTDWAIIDEVKDALTAATISGVTVFKTVSATTSPAQAKEVQFRGNDPIVIVRYISVSEDTGCEGTCNCVLSVELTIATKIDATGADESTRLAEILRLVNAAKNAIEDGSVTSATACGDGDFYHEQIEWGEHSLDVTEYDPWAVAMVPIEFGYSLTSKTSH